MTPLKHMADDAGVLATAGVSVGMALTDVNHILTSIVTILSLVYVISKNLSVFARNRRIRQADKAYEARRDTNIRED